MWTVLLCGVEGLIQKLTIFMGRHWCSIVQEKHRHVLKVTLIKYQSNNLTNFEK